MNNKILGVTILLIGLMTTVTDVLARSEFVIPAGAKGCKGAGLSREHSELDNNLPTIDFVWQP